VLPAVTHVVKIGEALDAARGEILKAHATGADGAPGAESFAAHARPGDCLAADIELEEMIIVPAHRRLDHAV
jgi:hypothetical protein